MLPTGPRHEPARRARSGRFPAALSLAGALLAWSSSASAAAGDGHAVVIRWIAPEGCPGEASLIADVERLLAGPLTRYEVPFEASAVVSHNASGFALHLETIGEGGSHTRELSGETCENVARATALIIAIAIDPAAANASPLAPAPDPRPPPAPAVSPSPPAPARDRAPVPASTSRASALGWSLRVLGGVDASSLPRPAPAISLAAGILSGALRFEAFGAYLSRERATLTARQAGGDLALAVGGARLCYGGAFARISLAGCAALEVGSIFGTGFGVPRPASGGAPWFAPSFGALGAIRVAGPASVIAGLDAVFPLVRPQFSLRGIGDVFRPPAATLRAALGIEVRFP